MKYIFSVTLFIVLIVMGINAQNAYLDSTFNSVGIVTINKNLNIDEKSTCSLLQPDGKIVLCGETVDSLGNSDILVMRINPNGFLDDAFGNGGMVQVEANKGIDKVNAIVLDGSGGILITGSTSEKDWPYNYDFMTLRLLPDGILDNSFGEEGRIITDLGTDREFSNTIAIQPDGKIVVAGQVDFFGYSDFAIVRYLADGNMDSLFGNQGIVKTTFLNDHRTKDGATCIVLEPDGKITVGGYAGFTADYVFALARYNQDGSLDSLFGVNGLVTTDLSGTESITCVQLLPDSRILVGGIESNIQFPWLGNIAFAQYLQNGSLDISFGQNGISKIFVGDRSTIKDMAIMSDGRILFCGSTYTDSGPPDQWLLSRLSSMGRLDTSFNSTGYLKISIGSAYAGPTKILIQSDAKIVLTGTAHTSLRSFAAARFIADIVSPVKEQNWLHPIRIFPNPSQGRILIEINEPNIFAFHLTIFDLSGALVFQKIISDQSKSIWEFELPNLQNGCYWIGLWNETWQFTQKLVIQN